MASIGNDKNGHKRILFVDTDGKRPTIRLGKMSKRQAEAIKVRVEHLVAAKISRTVPDDETSRWVAGLDDVLQGRLAAVGLIKMRSSAVLGEFLNQYVASRIDAKSSTVTSWGHTVRNLNDYFGPNKPLRDITPGDADEWCLDLLDQGLAADSTVRKRCSNAKQFFKAAVRKQLIQVNPFADLKSAVLANRERDYFVTQEEAQKVLDACPDAQWRLIFALSRYGGLRCPSEQVKLTWGDINWDGKRMTVHSPKTEHHPNGKTRVVPLFPELLPHLEAAYNEASEGTEYVITRYRDTKTNLRSMLLPIIAKAGLEPWEKLFQNLRATRETELAEIYPMHVVCAWIGNSPAVAAKHYLQVTDAHFAEAAQNPAQQAHAGGGTESQDKEGVNTKSPVLQGPASECDLVRKCPVVDSRLDWILYPAVAL
jgi:integrase